MLLAALLMDPLWTAEQAPVDFVSEVYPVLQAACIRCHGAEKAKGGLRLDAWEYAHKGGDEGPAIIPGKPEESPFFQRLVTSDEDERMPRGADALSATRIAAIRAWIIAGARWPDDAAEKAAHQQRAWWSFLPLAPAEPPAAEAWTRTPIDRFIAADLRTAGITPTPEADRRRLIRRATFDVTGLPPTPDEVDAFVADRSKDAWDQVVDRLLASPAAGERWARRWLDVVRYADSDGYEADVDRPNMFPYRDAVVTAFNRDLPFSTFAAWQLAGDELAPTDPLAVAATGYLATGPVSVMVGATPTDRVRLRFDELDDQVSTFSSAFLGLTVGCARCHDHKFDPISQEEYYRLLVPFASARRARLHVAPAAEVTAYAKRVAELDKPLAETHGHLRAWLDQLGDPQLKRIAGLKISDADKLSLRLPLDPSDPEQVAVVDRHQEELAPSGDFRARLTSEQQVSYARLSSAVVALLKQRGPPPATVLSIADSGAAPEIMHLLKRGMVETPGPEVTFGVLSVVNRGHHPRDSFAAPVTVAKREPFGLSSQPTLAITAGTGPSTRQRRALGAWLTDAEGGAGHLVARVQVNRIWQQYFGEGLVRTPNDFGTQGERPTHPALLDWLAREFIAGGWRMKAIHRLILTSAVYRQDSRFDAAKATRDPDNRLWWRQNPRALEAEQLRDAILAVSGALDRRMGGPGVKPPVPAALVATTSKSPYPSDAVDGPAVWRRSLYLFVKRSVALPLLEIFDRPTASASCGRRIATVVPTQGLLLMNDPFVRRQAGIFAARLATTMDAAGRVDRGFRLALGRPPEPVERAAALAFLAHGDLALTDFALALLGVAEFARVE